MNTSIASVSLSLLLALGAQAALTVTSENFNAVGAGTVAGGFGDFHGVANWGELNETSGNYSDFLLSAGGSFGGSGGTAGIQVGGAGYLYREIGTRDAISLLNIQGDNYRRAGQSGNMVVQVWSLDAVNGFTFAESGNDVSTVPGAVLVNSFVAAPPGANGVNFFNQTIDLSGVAGDSRLFIRFEDGVGGGNGNFAFVDNLQFALVPEPGAILLGGLGALFLLRRRR